MTDSIRKRFKHFIEIGDSGQGGTGAIREHRRSWPGMWVTGDAGDAGGT
jgi:hypothetical protein